MSDAKALKKEIDALGGERVNIADYLRYQGYSAHYDDPPCLAAAFAFDSLMRRGAKHIYQNDLIAGSIAGMFAEPGAVSPSLLEKARRVCANAGSRGFLTNFDHFAPDYETFLGDGIRGTIEKIRASRSRLGRAVATAKKREYLRAMETAMNAFGAMAEGYAAAAEEKAAVQSGEASIRFMAIAACCRALTKRAPSDFREALQLTWLAHTAFLYEGRYAMALGRMDQYLYPYYRRDIEDGSLTREQALAMLECTLMKIGERRRFFGSDDVVNIAVGGVGRDGGGAVNELSYLILEAVKNCGIPGPNLSARIYAGIPDDFLDECLVSIGTGLGYPALMNDKVNIEALKKQGYALEDCRDYCMVGCIENFIPGRQPPWSDGRFNAPKAIELALNDGRCMLTGDPLGPKTGDAGGFQTMGMFLTAMEEQLRFMAAEYIAWFRAENERYNAERYPQPFLSCFCRDCIGRGLDINAGGALYPSVHGAACMGIATVADSLAAIEEAVFVERYAEMTQLRDALLADYRGFEELRGRLLRAPKYGNNIDFADKYAVWYVRFMNELFSRYRTRDGGAIYTAMAANTSNIPAGREVAATPDGRRAREPLSDAASPMRGADRDGPTSVVNSVAKPDYTLVACGTVLNQKYSPEVFSDPVKRAALRELIKTYFRKGGQQIQINAVSRKMLEDAMEYPQDYGGLVVRVSGFSAYYTALSGDVQRDILQRTEH
ncbi:MAG TPA: pyruvate formate lyase family protein [Clostridiales bacterium]|nr:MAG: 4-hydroxyphenylacetate decarboxylase large subunit [Firmicutes bacterium ADurb.Bin262]HOU11083.1 pyruvate formate lyase family protein [Clostridiales bacterium]HQK72469.1 pyruvate formate lyase family protein [Clostridiales bacterium]